MLLIIKFDNKKEKVTLYSLLLVSVASHALPSYLGQAFNYLLYFYLVYYINKTKKVYKYSFLIVITVIFFIIYFLVYYSDVIMYKKYLLILIGKVLSISHIILLYNIFTEKECNICSKISQNSFGIYLIHSPLVYFTFKYFSNESPFLVIFINFIIFGLVSFFVTEIIRKLKLGFIIGEENGRKEKIS